MSYRDDLEAAKLRRNALARELQGVRERMDELEGLRHRAESLENELDRSGREFDRARAKVSLPLLQRVRVASPCNERWERMTGDERVRFCQRCEKSVYDLSALTSDEAETLLRDHGESLCVRFYRRRDGTILTSDCPVGRRRRFRRGALSAVAAGLLAVGGGVSGLLGGAGGGASGLLGGAGGGMTMGEPMGLPPATTCERPQELEVDAPPSPDQCFPAAPGEDRSEQGVEEGLDLNGVTMGDVLLEE